GGRGTRYREPRGGALVRPPVEEAFRLVVRRRGDGPIVDSPFSASGRHRDLARRGESGRGKRSHGALGIGDPYRHLTGPAIGPREVRNRGEWLLALHDLAGG